MSPVLFILFFRASKSPPYIVLVFKLPQNLSTWPSMTSRRCPGSLRHSQTQVFMDRILILNFIELVFINHKKFPMKFKYKTLLLILGWVSEGFRFSSISPFSGTQTQRKKQTPSKARTQVLGFRIQFSFPKTRQSLHVLEALRAPYPPGELWVGPLTASSITGPGGWLSLCKSRNLGCTILINMF